MYGGVIEKDNILYYYSYETVRKEAQNIRYRFIDKKHLLPGNEFGLE
jgi:hypothetical protein